MNISGFNTNFSDKVHKKNIETIHKQREKSYIKESKADKVTLNTLKLNDNKFSWDVAFKNMASGFIGQGKTIIKAMVQNPLATAGGIVGTTALVLAAPLIGISSAAVGTVFGAGFLLLGAGKTLGGLGKSVIHYVKNEKDQAEKDFKEIGEGAFDIASIAAPTVAGKAVKILNRSELGVIASNLPLVKNAQQFSSNLAAPVNSVIKYVKSFNFNNSVFTNIAKNYSKSANSPFAKNMSNFAPLKLINNFHNNLVSFSEKNTVKGIDFVNNLVDKFSPKHVIGSDFHGKKGSLAALASKNPNGKNLHINGDLVDKGQHAITAEQTNSRDVIKYVIDELPEAKLTYGNHEVQIGSTQENLATGYSDASKRIQVAQAKYKNLNDVLKKPSTNFYNEVLKPYGATGEGLEELVGQRLVKLYESKLEGINARQLAKVDGHPAIPESQKVLAELLLKQEKDGTWALKKGALTANKEFLQEVASKEFYRFYSNFGGNIDKATKSFAKLYGIKSDSLPLQKMIYGLKEFHSDFAQIKNRMHMFDVIKGGEKGDILLTHAGIPYQIDADGKTVLLPKAIFEAEEMAKQGKFSEGLMNKNLSPVYGGEANGELASFWFDRKDVTSEKIGNAYNEFNQAYTDATGKDINVSRTVIGHETRANGVLDPDTKAGWNNEFEHVLNNTDGVTTAGSIENGDLKVVNGKEMLQRRIVSAYDGKLTFADSAAGDAVDAKLGIIKPGEKETFIPGVGPAIESEEGVRNATKWRHGAGVQVQRDGSMRDLSVRNDGTKLYKSKPGDYIYEPETSKKWKEEFNQQLKTQPELRDTLQAKLEKYNNTNNSNLTLDEVSDSLMYYLQQNGKAESKVKDLLNKFYPDNYYHIEIAKPGELIAHALDNSSNMINPTLIKAKVNLLPTESIDDAIIKIMKNITSENHGISVIGAEKIDNSNIIRLSLGNGTDYTKALVAEITLDQAKSII